MQKKTQTVQFSLTHPNVRFTSSPDNIYIKVAVRGGDDQVYTGLYACLDSGANLSAINVGLARLLKAPLHHCDYVTATMADKTKVDVNRYTTLPITSERLTKTLQLFVMEDMLSPIFWAWTR